MKTITLYRLVLKDGIEDVELASNIQSVDMAGIIREQLYREYPNYKSIWIASYRIKARID